MKNKTEINGEKKIYLTCKEKKNQGKIIIVRLCMDSTPSHVIRVLSLVGYDVQHGYQRSSSNLLTDEHWDVLWSHSFPFGSMPELKNIRRHQKVNKVPGMGYITNKVSFLADSLQMNSE